MLEFVVGMAIGLLFHPALNRVVKVANKVVKAKVQ